MEGEGLKERTKKPQAMSPESDVYLAQETSKSNPTCPASSLPSPLLPYLAVQLLHRH